MLDDDPDAALYAMATDVRDRIEVEIVTTLEGALEREGIHLDYFGRMQFLELMLQRASDAAGERVN